MSIEEKQVHPDDSTQRLLLYRWEGRGLGVLLQHVNVLAPTRGQRQVEDLGRVLLDGIKLPLTLVRKWTRQDRSPTRYILQDLTGVLFPGETLLVLGSPGAGCSTALKIIANNRESFRKIEGEVTYGGLSPETITHQFHSEVLYNGEEDIHFPTLTVADTMDFAFRLRKPAGDAQLPPEKQFSAKMTDSMLSTLGMLHTRGTVVGNTLVRGVSGGERKRVSLAEALAVNPSVASWDNPIRGLDSSSALQFLTNLKEISRGNGMINAVSLYQASETMFQTCFDKVTVLYKGRVIYFGPVGQAKPYFMSLGFQPLPRQTTPEFLTAVTSPRERRISPNYAGPLYLDPDSLAACFRRSDIYAHMDSDAARYEAEVCTSSTVEAFHGAVAQTISNYRVLNTVEPSTMLKQVRVAWTRHFRLVKSDWMTLCTIIALATVNAVVCGSGFYMSPATSTGSFERSCALYFPLVYFFLNALTEVNKTVEARDILRKQHRIGLIHPVSFVITQAVSDIPVSILITVIFSCCYYFLVGLSTTASQFWIFALITFTHYGSVSAMFRMLGAWAPSLEVALLITGAAIPISTLYAGYAPPLPTQHRWGSWLRRVAPTPYALEALMSNEFNNLQLHCTASELIPNGPAYGDLSHQGCPLPMATPGSTTASGSDCLYTNYRYTRDHLWRNFGILIAFWFTYTVLAALGLTLLTRERNQTSGPVFKRGGRVEENASERTGEKAIPDNDSCNQSSPEDSGPDNTDDTLAGDKEFEDKHGNHSPDHSASEEVRGVFTFEGITYTVNVGGKEKRLLNEVSGYAKAGQLTALMGASGAGKTTLLDTLSQRKSEGRVEGGMLMNNQPLNSQFKRSCGFCMQQDVHESFTTVREALQFSAFMRQSADISQEEKMEYVEYLLSLLELGPIADALVGDAGDGKLSVEERKRVTIAVELAARPSALLFLDEPTSGLDSQAAFSIVSFLRRVAAEGIPVICTIHQPSGVIFDMFDHIFLLAPGGNTVYFGETGPNAACLAEYFRKYGAILKDDENPAEFVLATVTNQQRGSRDWAQTWRESSEAALVKERIANLKRSVLPTDESSRTSTSLQREYAQPLSRQIFAVTQRHWTVVWRNGSYNFSRIFKTIWYELIIAFTFFHASTDLQSLQNRMLGILLITWLIPINAADMQAVWFDRWAIFEGRERNGIYDYKALLVALITVEIPWNIGIYTLVFLCTYWTIGFTNTSIAGLVYFSFLLLSLFGTGFCYLMAAFFPNWIMAGYANSFFWVVLLIFCGLPVPHSAMNDFYRPWLFWTDPLRYFFGSTVSSVMHDVQVVCKERDFTYFTPPAGQTCSQYASAFLRSNPGYLVDEAETDVCAFCKYSTGDDYLSTLGFAYGDRWRDWAVFLGFCVTNFVLVFFATWFSRVKVRELKKRFGG